MSMFKTIFTAPADSFWSPTSREKRPVQCVVRLEELTAVKPVDKYHSAQIEVELTFPVSKTDIVDVSFTHPSPRSPLSAPAKSTHSDIHAQMCPALVIRSG